MAKLSKEEMSRIRKETIARIRAEGGHVGAPRKYDYKSIVELYEKHGSIAAVAEIVGCSITVVKDALGISRQALTK